MDTQIKERMRDRMVEMVEKAAGMRGDAIVPSEFTHQAIEMVQTGKAKVEQYSGGEPTLKGVYDLALKLFQAK